MTDPRVEDLDWQEERSEGAPVWTPEAAKAMGWDRQGVGLAEPTYERGESPAVGRLREYISNLVEAQGVKLAEGVEFEMSIGAFMRETGHTRNTAIKAIWWLMVAGEIRDLTPKVNNRAHRYVWLAASPSTPQDTDRADAEAGS